MVLSRGSVIPFITRPFSLWIIAFIVVTLVMAFIAIQKHKKEKVLQMKCGIKFWTDYQCVFHR